MSPLWTPSDKRRKESNITAFIGKVNARHQLSLQDSRALYQWSVDAPEEFWCAIWEFGAVIAATRGARVLMDRDQMPGARWFPDARLNFAENLLRQRNDVDALVFWGEDRVRWRLSHSQLHDAVSLTAQAMRATGVRTGDRVAAFMPNLPDTIIFMLATASIGAIWSSCSPDFGVQGVLDRFGQIEPKILFAVDGYFYNGKSIDTIGRVAQIADRLPSVEHVVLMSYTRGRPDISAISRGVHLEDFVAPYAARAIQFEQLPFAHPLYIVFSSGTTGVPKCIVHGAGGTLLQHIKEHRLHTDIKPRDRLFYFTTCGWMMWNWLVSGLASGATLLLYDGSPFYPGHRILFDYADAEGMNVFGTSAKYIDALNKVGARPAQTHHLRSLRTMTSTGSPLVAEGFDYVYQYVKGDILLSSISGGTDIISCFVLGDPTVPVYRGEIQGRGFGLKVEAFDENGRSVVGEKGELVCTAPFPSMPISFWNDPDGKKYHAAYFERFPGVWYHGDYMEITARGGAIIYGRSDATLNPGGVRIGTAEIYRQVEQLEEVLESVVIGQEWHNDVRVVLFVHLRDGHALNEHLTARIKQQIRVNTTTRHVPAKIIAVSDIPRTKSGKIVELAVRNIVHGLPIKNVEALANPEALDQFRDRVELSS